MTRLGLQGARGIGDVPIYLKYTNAKVTDSSGFNKALEFDVYIKAGSPNTPLSSLSFSFSFSNNPNTYTLPFTSKSLGVFRNKYTTGVSFSSTPYQCQVNVNRIDPTDLSNAPTQFDSLVHIRLPIIQCNDSSKIFSDTSMFSVGVYRATLSPLGYANYIPITLVDSVNILLCPDSIPTLYSVSPEIVRAGIKDTLTFIGKNIEPDTSNGYPIVYFKSADNPNIFSAIDEIDLLKVSDSIIQVIVPSNISGTPLNRGTAGSGKPRLQLSLFNTLQSPDSIVVDYAIINLRRGFSNVPAHRVNLHNQNTLGGHTIRYNPTFSSNTAAVKCFQRALQDWKCATGVNFIIGGDTSISLNAIDRVNIINFAPPSAFSNPAFAAAAFIGDTLNSIKCFGPNSEDTINQNIDFDILFKNTIDWHYDTTGFLPCPTTKLNFYTVALHELGHTHQIDHVLDASKVMHYQILSTEQKQLTSSDVDAGTNVVSYSINPDGLPCFPPMVQLSLTNCTSSVESFDISDSKLLLFPNPNNGSFSVFINSNNETLSNFYVTNTIGQRIFEEKLTIKKGVNNYQVELTHIKAGIYFISFVIDSKVNTQKLIVE